MSYQSPGDYEKLAELEQNQDNIRDVLFFQSVHGVSQSSPFGQGRKSTDLGPEMGGKSWSPIQRSVTDVDESGSSTGTFDRLDLHALSMIVTGTPATIPLRTIQHIGDGKIFTLTPKSGKTIELLPGGNIAVAAATQIADTAAGLFQYFADTDKVKCIAMGGGGGVSFPLTPDVKAHGNASTASPITPDLGAADAHWHQVTMNANLTINNPTGAPASGKVITYTFEFVGDGTPRTISWGSAYQGPPQVKATGTTILNFTTTDGGTTYKVYETAFRPSTAGGEVFTWTADHDASTFDLKQIDRLRFVADSGVPASAGDPSIYLTAAGHMTFNVALPDSFLFSENDVNIAEIKNGSFQLIRSVGVSTIDVINRDPTPTDLDQVGELRFRADEDGVGENIITYARLLAVMDDVSAGTMEGTLHEQVVEGGTLTTYFSLNKGRSGFVDFAKDIEMEGTTNIRMIGGDIIMGNNDITGLNAIAFTDAGGQIAGSASLPHMNFVLTGASTFRFTANSNNILDISDASGLVIVGTHNIALGNNNVTGVNQIAFNEANQTITDSLTGIDISVPDEADTIDLIVNGRVFSVADGIVDLTSNRLDFTEQASPATPPANQVTLYAKDSGGTSGLFWKDDAGTEYDLTTASAVQDHIQEGDSKVEVTDPGTGSIDIYVDSLAGRKFWFTATELNLGSLSMIGINQLQGKDTGNTISSLSTGWQLQVDAADQYSFRFGANEKYTFQDTLAIIGEDFRFDDTKGIRANSLANNYMYFTVAGTEPGTMGHADNVGSMVIPYKEDTTDSPSSSTLNNWFGDQNGSIGLQYDNDTPDVFTFWAKLNGTWHKAVLT